MAQGSGKSIIEDKNGKHHFHLQKFSISKIVLINDEERFAEPFCTKNRPFRVNLAMEETTDLQLICARKKYEIGFVIGDLFNMDWGKNQLSALSRFRDEPTPLEEIDFNSGIPLFLRLKLSISL
jgi:hypothetical protein